MHIALLTELPSALFFLFLPYQPLEICLHKELHLLAKAMVLGIA
jgi:hypothetical protein